MGREEELAALKRLDDQARNLERDASGPSVEEFIAKEREQSYAYGGQTVFGPVELEEPQPNFAKPERANVSWSKI
jgi:hypothetical protein